MRPRKCLAVVVATTTVLGNDSARPSLAGGECGRSLLGEDVDADVAQQLGDIRRLRLRQLAVIPFCLGCLMGKSSMGTRRPWPFSRLPDRRADRSLAAG